MRSRGKFVGTAVAVLGCLLVACTADNRDSTSGGSATGGSTSAGSATARSTTGGSTSGGSTSASSTTLDSASGRQAAPGSAPASSAATGTGTRVMQDSGPLPAVDVSGVTGDPQSLVEKVDVDRLMGDIEAIAGGPRHAVEDHDAALDAAEYVRTEFSATGLTRRSIDVTAFGVSLPTVWVEIPGKRCADRVFVMTGHYDTVAGSPGADDDASGVAAVLEAARVLADADLPATVVLAAVPFEEFGEPYHGAAALADALIADDRAVIGMVSAEMLGYALPEPDADGNPGDYLMLIGYPGAETLVATFAAAGAAWAGRFPARAGVFDESSGFVGRSDHAAFQARNIPAAFATDGANFRTPYYHGADDVPANIVREFLHGSVRTLVAGLIAAASLGVGDPAGADETAGACG